LAPEVKPKYIRNICGSSNAWPRKEKTVFGCQLHRENKANGQKVC